VAGKVPSHTCRWYPISWAEEEWQPNFKASGLSRPKGWPGAPAVGDPVLWACGAHRSCVKTLDAVAHYRLVQKEERAAAKAGRAPGLVDLPGLPSWYPKEEQAQYLRDTTPDGVSVDPDTLTCTCGKAFGSMEAAQKHVALKHPM
jgi:hypothetical protein